MTISIQIDYRENPSGIPELLLKNPDVMVSVSSLLTGDYIVNNEIGIERKSAEDFVQSLVSGRLFTQIARLKQYFPRPLLIVEGDPYCTLHKVHEQAIRGGLISVTVAWQVPVMFSKDIRETVEILMRIGRQEISGSLRAVKRVVRQGGKSGKHLVFLQSLPGIGPELSIRLLQSMGSLKAAINATEEELRQIEGIGEKKAGKIFRFLNTSFTDQR